MGDAGHVHLPSPGVVPQAEALVVELGCLNCHGAEGDSAQRFRPKAAPLLSSVGTRRSARSIAEFLEAPQAVKPGTRMPDVLAGLDASARKASIEDLTHYLVSLGDPPKREAFGATDGVFEAGRQLFHQVGCIACHGPQESLEDLAQPFDLAKSLLPVEAAPVDEDRYVPDGTLDPPQVSLDGLESRTTVAALASFLLDPLAVRPSGEMPNMNLTDREAQNIAAYLLRAQALGKPLSASPGLRYSYYEAQFPGGVLEFDGLLPARTGVLRGAFEPLEDPTKLVDLKHRGQNFAFEFTGSLIVEEAGTYGFRTESDDGSWIYVDGEEVVNNGGFHAVVSEEGSVELEAGTHSIRITYFEASGGHELLVHWTPPGLEERPLRGDDLVHLSLPLRIADAQEFKVDAARALRGEKRFRELGCVQCHEPSNLEFAGPLADCDPTRGCLSEQVPSGVPQYGWSAGQRAAVSEFLANLQELPRQTAAERVTADLARNRCYACHRRDEIGGPHPDRGDYFASKPGVDLGEEGRLPPRLDAAGSKLQRSWLHGVLQKGATARPGLLTRMPQFDGNQMEALEGSLVAADALDAPPVPSPSTLHSVAAGRRLVGTQGFGCIQCHEFNGYPSLGINAVDLGDMTGRIQYPWFRKLLEDPVALGMNSRMPLFWIDGKSPLPDVLDGSVIAQIDAIWNYLDMGDAMQLPVGMNVADSAFEVEVPPDMAPKLVGVFMKGLSPRVVAVGTSDLVHYAFDVENSRLAMAWRGRFFNARGTWEGRAGALELPPSAEVYEFPGGSPFALLEDPRDEWPATTERNPNLKVLGRRFDAERRPIFRYALGSIEIEEATITGMEIEGGGLLRRFHLTSPESVDGLFYSGAQGRQPVSFTPAKTGGYEASFEEHITW